MPRKRVGGGVRRLKTPGAEVVSNHDRPGRKGMVKLGFGKTGASRRNRVDVPRKTYERAKKLGTKLYEDATYGLPQPRGPKKRRR